MPAMTCATLAVMAGLQLALPWRTEPPADAGLAPRRLRDVAAASIPAYPALATTNPFSPTRSGGGELAASGIEDCAVIGTMTIAGRTGALVKAGGAARLVRVGEAACGGKLVGVAATAATFAGAGWKRTLEVGQAPRPQGAAAQAPEAAQ